MRIKPFKIACLTVSMVALLSALCLAAESTALSDAVQAQIEAQAKEMNAAGVPAEPARIRAYSRNGPCLYKVGAYSSYGRAPK